MHFSCCCFDPQFSKLCFGKCSFRTFRKTGCAAIRNGWWLGMIGNWLCEFLSFLICTFGPFEFHEPFSWKFEMLLLLLMGKFSS